LGFACRLQGVSAPNITSSTKRLLYDKLIDDLVGAKR